MKTLTAYRRAKAWWMFRYRFLPWCIDQLAGFMFGVLVILVFESMVLPDLVQSAWDQAYRCEQHADSFTCYVRDRVVH